MASSILSNYAGAVTDYTMTVESYSATSPIVVGSFFQGMQVADNLGLIPRDGVNWSALLTDTQINGFNPRALVSLSDETATAFSDAELVHVGDLSGWTSAPGHTGFWRLDFNDGTGSSGVVLGQITSVTAATSVPEPATLALLGIGLAGLGFRRRKRIAN